MNTKKVLLSLAFVLFLPLLACATHIAGGYISYTIDAKNPRTYHFTQTLYTNSSSSAEDPIIYVNMGDGNTVEAARFEVRAYSRQFDVEVFNWSYTYATAGDFTVAWTGTNRTINLMNVPAPSDQKPFYIYTHVSVNPLLPNEHGIRLASIPLFVAYTGEETRHNFIAYDADGDKLTYELLPPKTSHAEAEVKDIAGYVFPEGLTIDKFGELRWRAPATKGFYAVAVKVTEHRDGQPVGYIVIELELQVLDRAQQPSLTLLNQNRLLINYDGSVLARPGELLKLEYFLENADGADFALLARQFSDLDTLDLASPVVTLRDSADGYAVTLTLTPTADLERAEPYIIGMRGQANIGFVQGEYYQPYYFEWSYVYLIVGQQQPTAAEEDLAEAGFTLYPNPISDRFVIEAPDMPAMHIQIFDATGKAVSLFSLKPGRNYLTKPATMAKSLYFYTITSRYRLVGSGRLIVL